MSSGSARSPIDVDVAANEATERGQAWGLTDEQMAQLTDMARTAAQQYNELLEEVAASRAASSTAPATQDTTPARQNDPARVRSSVNVQITNRMPAGYDGTTDFRVWLKRYEAAAEAAHWPNEVRAATLGLYLEDDYFDSWETLATKEDWASDKEMLLGLFARWQPDEILKAFHGLSWDGRQPFSAFAARLSRYMKDYNRALPDTSKLPKEVMDRQIFDRCVEAAPLAAQPELRKRSPRTIKDICDIVDDYKASAQASKAVAAGLPNDKTGPEKPVPTQAEFEAMMTRSLREIFQPVTEGLGQVLQTVKKQQGQQGQGRPQGLRKCGICEGPHLTHLCTKKKHEKGCFICGKEGHMARRCPQRARKGQGNDPLLRTLVDTGSCHTIVSKDAVPRAMWGQIRSIPGMVINYLLYDTAVFKDPWGEWQPQGSEEEMASVGFTISAMVVEELYYDVVLGHDFLCHFGIDLLTSGNPPVLVVPTEEKSPMPWFTTSLGGLVRALGQPPKSVVDTTHYSPSVVLRPARPVANVVPKATELVSDQESSLPKRRGRRPGHHGNRRERRQRRRRASIEANYEEYSTDSSVPSMMSPVVATVAIQTGEDLVAPLGCQPKGHVEFVEGTLLGPGNSTTSPVASYCEQGVQVDNLGSAQASEGPGVISPGAPGQVTHNYDILLGSVPTHDGRSRPVICTVREARTPEVTGPTQLPSRVPLEGLTPPETWPDEDVDPDDMKDDDIAGPMRFAVPDFQDEALEMPAFPDEPRYEPYRRLCNEYAQLFTDTVDMYVSYAGSRQKYFYDRKARARVFFVGQRVQLKTFPNPRGRANKLSPVWQTGWYIRRILPGPITKSVEVLHETSGQSRIISVDHLHIDPIQPAQIPAHLGIVRHPPPPPQPEDLPRHPLAPPSTVHHSDIVILDDKSVSVHDGASGPAIPPAPSDFVGSSFGEGGERLVDGENATIASGESRGSRIENFDIARAVSRASDRADSERRVRWAWPEDGVLEAQIDEQEDDRCDEGPEDIDNHDEVEEEVVEQPPQAPVEEHSDIDAADVSVPDEDFRSVPSEPSSRAEGSPGQSPDDPEAVPEVAGVQASHGSEGSPPTSGSGTSSSHESGDGGSDPAREVIEGNDEARHGSSGSQSSSSHPPSMLPEEDNVNQDAVEEAHVAAPAEEPSPQRPASSPRPFRARRPPPSRFDPSTYVPLALRKSSSEEE
ncbi:hypothetical protein FOZ60_002745 [Perkinsus olseni]|uniref:CCHC-type domain-containing protein n=2 Tax=Perkinsus olseni TaxID=32597 RepID=A0A7J6NXB8_PEROL|nr:hypothetical protein FOZ60_002745 [Perkinsus olseni]